MIDVSDRIADNRYGQFGFLTEPMEAVVTEQSDGAKSRVRRLLMESNNTRLTLRGRSSVDQYESIRGFFGRVDTSIEC